MGNLAQLVTQLVFPGGKCVRWDIVIRYIGVRTYERMGVVDWMYHKLNQLRKKRPLPMPESPIRFVATIEKTKRIQAVVKAIRVGSNGRLVEGAHRLAVAMYFDIAKDIPVKPKEASGGEVPWSWVEKHFTPDEQTLIKAAAEELRTKFGPVSYDELRRQLDAQRYPPNHHYDPETLKPLGLLAKRAECLCATAPEMMAGGGSFLDIGSNKGWLCLHLRDRYERVCGYEPIVQCVKLAEAVRRAHGFANIRFCEGRLASISLGEAADVVYAGHFNHHEYNREIQRGIVRFTFMRQLATLAKRILVVDGPFDFSDVTAADVARKGNWTDDQRKAFSVEGHAGAIVDSHRLLRVGPSGTGPRQIAVFEKL